MQIQAHSPHKLAARLGFWSAIVIAVIFILFPICYVAILQIGGVFEWTNLADYTTVSHDPTAIYRHAAQAMILLFTLLYVILLSVIYEFLPASKRMWGRTSLLFGLGFAVLSGSHYFMQISTVRLNLTRGTTEGLTQFVQANPAAAIAAINMLGVTLFLGLSSLFIAPVFDNGRIERIIKIAFYGNAISCLLGGVAFIFDWVALIFLTVNLGMGAAVLVAAIALTIRFHQMAR
ncbi:MAG: hypothetical protein H6662_00445 [Ardenticatenaceae bacterium]|nr:hypothetical protein [Ardenticatenaceae bacterium]MCB8989870.1 hypothetical protein [Ardenticatenaceae bacterium]MCB9005657.1 hypothetical protein [Ardenticatenaceae bacterium]